MNKARPAAVLPSTQPPALCLVCDSLPCRCWDDAAGWELPVDLRDGEGE